LYLIKHLYVYFT